MQDEKFISIEYSKWNSFYKPLEKKVEALERELEEEKLSKQIDVIVTTGCYPSSINMMYHNENRFLEYQICAKGTKDYVLQRAEEIADWLKTSNRHDFISWKDMYAASSEIDKRFHQLSRYKKEFEEEKESFLKSLKYKIVKFLFKIHK